MTQLWNLSIGEVKDFNKHVEEIIKYHLASLPKLTAASQLDNGSYPFDTNNELGVVTFLMLITYLKYYMLVLILVM